MNRFTNLIHFRSFNFIKANSLVNLFKSIFFSFLIEPTNIYIYIYI